MTIGTQGTTTGPESLIPQPNNTEEFHNHPNAVVAQIMKNEGVLGPEHLRDLMFMAALEVDKKAASLGELPENVQRYVNLDVEDSDVASFLEEGLLIYDLSQLEEQFKVREDAVDYIYPAYISIRNHFQSIN